MVNLWDILLSAAVVAALALAVALCVRKKKRGNSCCGGNCPGCRDRYENGEK